MDLPQAALNGDPGGEQVVLGMVMQRRRQGASLDRPPFPGKSYLQGDPGPEHIWYAPTQPKTVRASLTADRFRNGRRANRNSVSSKAEGIKGQVFTLSSTERPVTY